MQFSRGCALEILVTQNSEISLFVKHVADKLQFLVFLWRYGRHCLQVFSAWLLAFKRVHDRVLKSRLPACFFLLISLSRLFVRPNPDPALFFLQVSCFHLIQCLRLTFLQQGALMFKVLDFVISDRNFFFLFCLFIYVFFFWVHRYKKGFLRSEFWPFGNSQLSWVDGCFDFFTAKFH